MVLIDSEGIEMEFLNCITHVKFIAPDIGLPDPPEIDLASPQTLALLSCNALYNPANPCNHWVALLLKQQLGEVKYNEVLKRTKQQSLCEEKGFRDQLDILAAMDPEDDMIQVEIDYIKNELERILTRCIFLYALYLCIFIRLLLV